MQLYYTRTQAPDFYSLISIILRGTVFANLLGTSCHSQPLFYVADDEATSFWDINFSRTKGKCGTHNGS